MKSRITAAEAQKLIESKILISPDVLCPIERCLGRILRQSVVSDRPFPPFDRSMMDGYAIRAGEISDTGVFEITARCSAGEEQISLDARTAACAEIMTGAIVPANADCVVPYEETRLTDPTKMQLLNPKSHSIGDCIHKLGSDRGAGEILLSAGLHLDPRHLAVAASCGYSELLVAKRPSIAVISTGDELVDINSEPAAHQIRRSNDLTIQSTLLANGFPANESRHLVDDPEVCAIELERIIEGNDIVIISGGISMGRKDFIPGILDQLGLDCHFHGVSQKPGKPFGFWTNQNCAVFALPGNPNSTLTCLHQYVIPGLQFSIGGATRTKTKVTLNEEVQSHNELTVFLPVRIDSSNKATPCPTRNSGDLVSILQSDGYIELPAADKLYFIGTEFIYRPWS